MCYHCNKNHDWDVVQAKVTNNSGKIMYVVDAKDGRVITLDLGETREIYVRRHF